MSEPKNAPKGKGGVSSSAAPTPLTDQDIRLHALNLAVAGRKDSIRMSFKEEKRDPYEDFADGCIADATKYETYIRGEA